MKELFRFENVHISYGQEEIIHGVNFAIHEGEFCALLGLNGSGKSTILHAACGFLPMKGTCIAGGQDCSGFHEKQRARQIAFIPQNSSIGGGRSVLDVVLMGFNAKLGLFESPSEQDRNKAIAILDKLGYDHLKNKDFGTLSQGQKQLIILARCMAQDAPVMLMDEPDSALDFLNRHMVLGKIREMVHSEGKGGLVTLHDPNFAMNYCDRLLLLKDGILMEELSMANATVNEVKEKLSLIYGAIDVLSHAGSFLMGKACDAAYKK